MGIREDKQTTTKIAQNIKNAREKAGLTQEELAKKAGLDSNSLAKIERGESKPFGTTLVKIIKALGVKSSDILSV